MTHTSTARFTNMFALLLPLCAACVLGTSISVGCAAKNGGDAVTSSGVVRTRDWTSFPVEGMACPNCAKDIVAYLERVPGVTSAKVDFASARATVNFNPDQSPTLAQLQAAVATWHKEHFAQEEDPECLDPAKRKELQQKGA